jgi:hypothetical protein
MLQRNVFWDRRDPRDISYDTHSGQDLILTDIVVDLTHGLIENIDKYQYLVMGLLCYHRVFTMKFLFG